MNYVSIKQDPRDMGNAFESDRERAISFMILCK
jgi:hypothetical protein